MASDSKYNIDCGNIRPGGKRTKGLYVGGTESNWAQLGNTRIYDRVLYQLAMNDVTGADPAGETFMVSNYVTTNQKKHGNGQIEGNLDLNETSFTFQPNTSTANTVSTSITITQFDSDLDDYVGASVTWNLEQEKDYPTSISLLLGSVPDIPANGGTVSSAPYTATTYFRSGNQSTEYGSVSFDNEVSGNDLGTVPTERKIVGSLTASVTYTCNGVTVNDNASIVVYQEANVITSTTYSDFTVYGVQYEYFDSDGGTKSPSRTAYATQTKYSNFTSGKQTQETIYPECEWNISSEQSWLTINDESSPSTTATAEKYDGDENRSTLIYTDAQSKETDGATGRGITTIWQTAVPRRLTGLTLTLISAPNIPSIGGTVTIDDVRKTVMANFDDGTSNDVTELSEYSASTSNGATAVTATASDEAGVVGTIKVYASYSGLNSNDASIEINKVNKTEVSREVTALTVNPITVSSPVSYIEQTVPAYGNASVDLTYKINYDNGSTEDFTVSNYTDTGITYEITTNADWCIPIDSTSRSTSFNVEKNKGEKERICQITTKATYDGNTSVTGSANSTFEQQFRVHVANIVFTIQTCPDIPVTGGTVTHDECTYNIIAHFKDGSTTDVTNECEVDWTKPSCTENKVGAEETERRVVGKIGGTAKYIDEDGNDYTNYNEIDVYQEPNTITYGSIEFYGDYTTKIVAPASGTTYDFATYDFEKPFMARRQINYASGDVGWKEITDIRFAPETYTVPTLGTNVTTSETHETVINVIAFDSDSFYDSISFDIYQEINKVESTVKNRLEIIPCEYGQIPALGGIFSPTTEIETYLHEAFTYTSTATEVKKRRVDGENLYYEWTVISDNPSIFIIYEKITSSKGNQIRVEQNIRPEERCAELTFTVRSTDTESIEMIDTATITVCQDAAELQISQLDFINLKKVTVGASGQTGITKPASYEVWANWNDGRREDVTELADIVNEEQASYDVPSLEYKLSERESIVYLGIPSHAEYEGVNSKTMTWTITQEPNVIEESICNTIEVTQPFTHSIIPAEVDGIYEFGPDVPIEGHVKGYYRYSSDKIKNFEEYGGDILDNNFFFDVIPNSNWAVSRISVDPSTGKEYGHLLTIGRNASTGPRSVVIGTRVKYKMLNGDFTELSDVVERTITQEGQNSFVTRVWIEGGDVYVPASGGNVTRPSNYKVYADFNTGEQRVDVTDSAIYGNNITHPKGDTFGGKSVPSLGKTIQIGDKLILGGIESTAKYGDVTSDKFIWNIYQSENIIVSSACTIEVTQPFEYSKQIDAAVIRFPEEGYLPDNEMQGHVSYSISYTSGYLDEDDVTGGEADGFEFSVSSDSDWLSISAITHDFVEDVGGIPEIGGEVGGDVEIPEIGEGTEEGKGSGIGGGSLEIGGDAEIGEGTEEGKGTVVGGGIEIGGDVEIPEIDVDPEPQPVIERHYDWRIVKVEDNTSTESRRAMVQTFVRYWMKDGSVTGWSKPKSTRINQKGADIPPTVWIEGGDVHVPASGAEGITYPSNYKVYAQYGSSEPIDVTEYAIYRNNIPSTTGAFGHKNVPSLENNVREDSVPLVSVESTAEYDGVVSDIIKWSIYQEPNVVVDTGYTIEVTQPFVHEPFDAEIEIIDGKPKKYGPEPYMQGHFHSYSSYTSGYIDKNDITGDDNGNFEFNVKSNVNWIDLSSGSIIVPNAPTSKNFSWEILILSNNTSQFNRTATITTEVCYWMTGSTISDWSKPVTTTITQKGAGTIKPPLIESIEWD